MSSVRLGPQASTARPHSTLAITATTVSSRSIRLASPLVIPIALVAKTAMITIAVLTGSV